MIFGDILGYPQRRWIRGSDSGQPIDEQMAAWRVGILIRFLRFSQRTVSQAEYQGDALGCFPS